MVLYLCCSITSVQAETVIKLKSPQEFQLDIPAQPLIQSLNALSNQTETLVLFPYDLVETRRAKAVKGFYTIESALNILLHRTSLMGRFSDKGVLVISVGDTNANKDLTRGEMMNTKRKLLASSMALFLGSGGVGYLNAAEMDKSSDGASFQDIDEVIVTASRRSQSIQDVAMSVSAINPEAFTEAGLTDIGEVIAYTPGVVFEPSRVTPGSGAVTMRGVGQLGSSFTTATVGVYVDGVPVTSNSPWGIAGALTFDGLLGDVERVEFLKGPQGTLYGSTSIGGTLKYITRKPSLEKISGFASVDISETKGGGFNQIYNGRITTPIVEDKLGFTLASFWEDDGGLVDRVDRVVINEDVDAFERYGVSADLYYKISDIYNLRGRVLRQKSEYNGNPRVDLDPNTKESRYDTLANDLAFSDSFLESSLYSVTFEAQFDSAILTATTSYLEDEVAATGDLIRIFGRPTVLGALFPDQELEGTIESAPNEQNLGSEKFTQEIQLASIDGEKWEWIVGLYYADETTFSNVVQSLQPGNLIVANQQRPSEYEEYAAFGNLTYYISSGFDLTLGARLSRAEMSFQETKTSDSVNVGNSADPVSNIKDTVDTWSFAARYRPSEEHTLYARIASGYRPATANFPIVDLDGRTDDTVDSDSLWSYEVGVKGRLVEGFVNYDLALWYLDWDKFQTEAKLPTTSISVPVNAEGGISANGIEGSVVIRPLEGFSIVTNFSYTESTLNEDEENLDGLKGQQLPGVPEWTFSTRMNYGFTLGADLDASVSTGVRYVGSSRSAFTDGDAGDPLSNLPSDSYVLVDAGARLTYSDIAINLYLKNLLNKEAFIATSHSSTSVSGVPVEPRTVGISLSLSF